MHSNIPIYFPGDTIRLRLRLEHDANLAEVWAAFEREVEEDVRSLKDVVWTLRIRDPDYLRQLDRVGRHIVSEVLLESSVLEGGPLPGTDQPGRHPEPLGAGVGRPGGRVALLRAEDPADCHRGIVAPWLREHGVEIEELEAGMLARRPDSPQVSLFESYREEKA